MSGQRDRHAKATLTSLPKEIITAISLFLPDRASVEAFSLTSRYILPSCERALWRTLQSSLQGAKLDDEPAAEGPFDYDKTFEHTMLELARRAANTREATQRMKGKIKAMMNAASARRWGMVEDVSLELIQGATTGYLQILDNVPNLRSLELRSPPQFPCLYVNDASDHDTIDVRIIGTGIHFPSLAHLSIGKRAIRFDGFLPLLCNSAPSLISVIADLSGHLAEEWPEDGVIPLLPSYERPTRIQHLRLAIQKEDGDAQPVIDLLSYTPQLRRLYLSYDGDYAPEVEKVARIMARLAWLEALAWNVSSVAFWCALQGVGEESAEPYFHRLRKLFLRLGVWHEIFESVTPLPVLEAIFFDCSPAPPLLLPGRTSFPEPARALSMTPYFAEHLTDCPRLHLIHILRDTIPGGFELFALGDEIMSSGTAECIIRSFKRGKKPELLHARLLSDFYELSDDVARHAGTVDNSATFLAYTGNGSDRVKSYERRAEASWQELTSYDDEAVPRDIMSRMREVEGVKVGTWEGRGIEVGEAAWKVLTDWAAAEAATQKVNGE